MNIQKLTGICLHIKVRFRAKTIGHDMLRVLRPSHLAMSISPSVVFVHSTLHIPVEHEGVSQQLSVMKPERCFDISAEYQTKWGKPNAIFTTSSLFPNSLFYETFKKYMSNSLKNTFQGALEKWFSSKSLVTLPEDLGSALSTHHEQLMAICKGIWYPVLASAGTVCKAHTDTHKRNKKNTFQAEEMAQQ